MSWHLSLSTIRGRRMSILDCIYRSKNMDHIPTEILETIFTFINGNTLSKDRFVCSRWNQIIESRTSILSLHRLDDMVTLVDGKLASQNGNLNPEKFLKRFMITNMEIRFDSNDQDDTMKILDQLLSSFGSPIVINRLTIMNSRNGCLDSIMKNRPNFITHYFNPINLDIHPWEFSDFIKNPEYIRLPLAKSISISNGEGYYYVGEPISQIWPFLYDQDGYPNRSIVSLSTNDENQEFLSQLVNLFDSMEEPTKFFEEVNVMSLASNMFERWEEILKEKFKEKVFPYRRQRSNFFVRERKDGWKLKMRFSYDHFNIKIRKED